MKHILSTFCLFAACGPLMAQNAVESTVRETVKDSIQVTDNKALSQVPMKEIKGRIFDSATKQPAVGVSVSAYNDARYAAMTDENGIYVIKVPYYVTSLWLRADGYSSQQIGVGKGDAVVDSWMYSNTFGERYDNQTSAFNTKTVNVDYNNNDISIDGQMQMKLGGDVRTIMRSGVPGQGIAMFMNGLNSLNANAQPLVVIDGVITDMQLSRPSLHDGFFNNLFANIMVEDIEKISVMKNGTAIYGAKGANGVILVTTKAGKKGHGTVTYDGSVGVSMLNRRLDLLDAEGYMELQRRAYAYSGASPVYLTSPMENLFYYKKDSSGNYVYDENGLLIASPKYNTDWQKVMTQNALVNDHSLSFTSGGEKTSVYASISYQDVEGLLRGTYSNRLNGTINVKSQITDWLDIQAVATGGSTQANNSDSENGMGQGALRNMMEMPPIVPVRYEDGTWGRKDDVPLGEVAENPLRLMQSVFNIQKNNYFVMSLTANMKLYKDLTLTVKGDYQMNNGKNISYAMEKGLAEVTESNNGYATIGYSDTKNWSNEDYLTWSPTFFDGKLRSSFVLGASWYYEHSESATAGDEDLLDGSFD